MIKKMASILCTAACLLALSFAAFAAEAKTVNAEIPVTAKLGGTVLIRAEGASPEAAEQKLVIPADPGKGTFHLTFTEPDKYSYRIWQEKGADPDVTYDETVYTVTLMVLADEAGNLSYITVFADGTSVKPSEVAFENRRKSTTTYTGGGGGGGGGGTGRGAYEFPSGGPGETTAPYQEVKGVDRDPEGGSGFVPYDENDPNGVMGAGRGVLGRARSPKTGDDAPFIAIGVMFLLSLFGFAATFRKSGNEKKNKSQ